MSNVLHLTESPQSRLYLIFTSSSHRSAGCLWPAADPATLTSLEAWLASIKLTKYLANLQRAGVTSLDAAARLTEPDLTALGVTLVGHQKIFVREIAALRQQVRASRADACFV